MGVRLALRYFFVTARFAAAITKLACVLLLYVTVISQIGLLVRAVADLFLPEGDGVLVLMLKTVLLFVEKYAVICIAGTAWGRRRSLWGVWLSLLFLSWGSGKMWYASAKAGLPRLACVLLYCSMSTLELYYVLSFRRVTKKNEVAIREIVTIEK